MTNKPLLVFILLVLLALRFIVQPWFEHISLKQDELITINTRLSKVLSLQQTEQDLYGQLDQLIQLEKNGLATIQTRASSQQAMLATQNLVQTELEKNKIRLELFEWVGEQEISVGLVEARVNIRAEGLYADIAVAMLKLEQQQVFYKLQGLQLSQGNNLSWDSSAQLQMQFDVLYRLEASNGPAE